MPKRDIPFHWNVLATRDGVVCIPITKSDKKGYLNILKTSQKMSVSQLFAVYIPNPRLARPSSATRVEKAKMLARR